MKRLLPIAALTLLVILGAWGSASSLDGADIKEFPSCPICGMNRQKFAHSRVYAQFGDGSSLGTCSVFCLGAYMVSHLDKIPQSLMVADFKTRKLVPMAKAHWVIVDHKPGVMTRRAKWAFAQKEDALGYIKVHGGRLADYRQAMQDVFCGMHQDLLMIRAKRQRKRAMMRHKKMAALAVPKPGPRDKCPVCGMFVAKYPHWVAVVGLKDGSNYFFDGAKDMFKFIFKPARYLKAKKTADIKTIYVTDYYQVKPIAGRRAFYVIGSDVLGPMGRELIPFARRADALVFKKDHKGQKVLSFPQVTPQVIKWLDR